MHLFPWTRRAARRRQALADATAREAAAYQRAVRRITGRDPRIDESSVHAPGRRWREVWTVAAVFLFVAATVVVWWVWPT
jgi:hypothetical protein